jgi:hypothetical protein
MFILIFLLSMLLFQIFSKPNFKPGDILIYNFSIKEFQTSYPDFKVISVGKNNYLLERLGSYNNENFEQSIGITDDLCTLWKR